ncbi:MAG TPA: class II fructose-bisphosphatase [Fimbriimonadales bacterium]|nr:class II fructose-bisphosphatase [Fimbriimonadales bacterium]
MDRNLALEFVRVTEAAALASARWVGKGDRHAADQAACDAMRSALCNMDIAGYIAIGEGERDEAPMLYIGEEVGTGNGPRIDIAVDPLEGTNLCANGVPNAISVLAAAVQGDGSLMHAPDCYMDKLVVSEAAKGAIDITLPPTANLKAIARCLGKPVDELTIGILDRPRHEKLISEIRRAGARIRLVGDGDITLGLAAIDEQSGIDALFGIGGAPEGVITAAAVRAYGGDMQARLVFRNDEERERAARMVKGDIDRVLYVDDLASGNVMFAATGITSGDILKGVRFTANGAYTESLVMRSATGTVSRIETRHRFTHLPKF